MSNTGINLTEPATGGPLTSFRQAVESAICLQVCPILDTGIQSYNVFGDFVTAGILTSVRNASCGVISGDIDVGVDDAGFSGGQCVGDSYQINVQFKAEGFNVQVGALFDIGPIVGLVVVDNPTNNNQSLLLVHGDGAGGTTTSPVNTSPPNTNYEFFDITGIVNLTNPADPCGDPPDIQRPLPPEITGTPQPSGTQLAPSNTYNITYENAGQMITIPIEIGEIVIEEGQPFQFDINGLRHLLSPVGELIADIPGIAALTAGQAALAAQAATESLMNQCVRSAVCVTPSGTLEAQDCDGTMLVENYGGQGLEGIESQINALCDIVGAQVLGTCDVQDSPASNVPEALIFGETLTTANQTGTDQPISEFTKRIRYEITVPDGFKFIYKGTIPDRQQGRFGQISFGVGAVNSVSWFEPVNAYYKQGVVDVPDSGGELLWMRFASEPGASIQVYDTGLR